MHTLPLPTEHRKRRQFARLPVTLAVRHVARRWRLPLATARATAEAAGLHGGDR